MAHTPGPWRADRGGSGWYVRQAEDIPGIMSIAQVFRRNGYATGEANMKLLTMAPRLLNVLEAVMGGCVAGVHVGTPTSFGCPSCNEARAAIAQATGEK